MYAFFCVFVNIDGLKFINEAVFNLVVIRETHKSKIGRSPKLYIYIFGIRM